MKLVVVDNYDSFTHNLVDLLERLGATCEVVLNDQATLGEVVGRRPAGFVISPGPCSPNESGVSLPLAEAAVRGELAAPLLGVCLGHQAIAAALGARIVRAAEPLHGKTCAVHHRADGMFAGMPQGFAAARYNSLLVDRSSVPTELEITAWSESGEVLGLRHLRFAVEGVQFHPESFLTPLGPDLVRGWLEACMDFSESAA